MRRCSARYVGAGKQGSEIELEPANWKPLELRIGSRCAEFMWMWGEAGIQFYKHICTRRYLLLDSAGRCYQRGRNGLEPADVQAELKRVRE